MLNNVFWQCQKGPVYIFLQAYIGNLSSSIGNPSSSIGNLSSSKCATMVPIVCSRYIKRDMSISYEPKLVALVLMKKREQKRFNISGKTEFIFICKTKFLGPNTPTSSGINQWNKYILFCVEWFSLTYTEQGLHTHRCEEGNQIIFFIPDANLTLMLICFPNLLLKLLLILFSQFLQIKCTKLWGNQLWGDWTSVKLWSKVAWWILFD